MTTRDEAIQSAADALTACAARVARMTPEQIAAEAHTPGGPSREQIAAVWRDRRTTTTGQAAA